MSNLQYPNKKMKVNKQTAATMTIEQKVELKTKMVGFLVPASITINRIEDLENTTAYKNKAKLHLKNAVVELKKQDNLYREVWKADEVNMMLLNGAMEDIIDMLSTAKLANIVRIRDTMREMISNPDFEKIPVVVKNLDSDLVLSKTSGNHISLWLSNPKMLDDIKAANSEWEAVLRGAVADALKKSGAVTVPKDVDKIWEVVNDRYYYLIEDRGRVTYSVITKLAAGERVTLKPIRKK